MAKANKSVKTVVKAARGKPGSKGKPVLRAIKGGKNGKPAPTKSPPPKPVMAKPVMAKPVAKSAAPKPIAFKPAPAVADDVPVIALNLEPAKLSPAMAAYFKKCQEKLGFVPNVLLAYAFDMAKLEAFAAFYNDLMLAPSGLRSEEHTSEL